VQETKQGTGWNDILLPSKVNGLNRSRGRKHSSQPRHAPCPQNLLEHLMHLAWPGATTSPTHFTRRK